MKCQSCGNPETAKKLITGPPEPAPIGWIMLSRYYGPNGFDPEGNQPEQTMREPAEYICALCADWLNSEAMKHGIDDLTKRTRPVMAGTE